MFNNFGIWFYGKSFDAKRQKQEPWTRFYLAKDNEKTENLRDFVFTRLRFAKENCEVRDAIMPIVLSKKSNF